MHYTNSICSVLVIERLQKSKKKNKLNSNKMRLQQLILVFLQSLKHTNLSSFPYKAKEANFVSANLCAIKENFISWNCSYHLLMWSVRYLIIESL